MNKTLFFGQYDAHQQLFLRHPAGFAPGLPQGRELEILNEVKDKVPPEVFTRAYANPVERHAAEAAREFATGAKLLKTAGCNSQGNKLVNATTGKPLTAEYLIFNGPTFEKVGAGLSDRPAQDRDQPARSARSTRRNTKTACGRRDYDMIYLRWAESMSPGNEQTRIFRARGRPTARARATMAPSRTRRSTSSFEHILYTKDRDELVAATKALDRVLLWNHYVVPGWALRASNASRAGTASPIPIRFRPIRSASRPSGGGTRTRRKQVGAANERRIHAPRRR